MPPLSGLEVLGQGEDVDGTLVYNMGLNINLRSMTIEQVLAIRKKQVRELVKDLRWDAELGKNTLYHRRSSIDSQASDFEPSQMMAAGLIPDFEEEDDEEEE